MFDVIFMLYFPSLWEGLGEGAKLSGVQALSPTLSQRERKKKGVALCVLMRALLPNNLRI